MTIDYGPPADTAVHPETIDAAFSALRDQNRRFALYFLLEHEQASVSETADVVTSWRHATSDGLVEPQCRKQHYLELVHTHIPKLVGAGIVDYDEDRELLSLSPCPDPIRDVIARSCRLETCS